MTDIISALDAAAQPPMANGEVLFDEPWQGRIFGMAVALHEGGLFEWREFQDQLISVIGKADEQSHDAQEYTYYKHFQQALGELLAQKGVLGSSEVDFKVSELAQRPHGHDHVHDHPHVHD